MSSSKNKFKYKKSQLKSIEKKILDATIIVDKKIPYSHTITIIPNKKS
jgi:hypothetical protein